MMEIIVSYAYMLTRILHIFLMVQRSYFELSEALIVEFLANAD